MLSTLYWVFFALIVILLAYASPFSFVPLIFVSGGVVLGLGYLVFLTVRRKRSGVWEHSEHKFRFVGSVFLYVALYWTVVGINSNVKEHREFWARYEPYIENGRQHGYTFYYVDYDGCFERIDSPDLNRYLSEKNPDRVRLVLEVVKDFGRLRAYSVASVESIPVDMSRIDGTPPWSALRAK